MSFRAGARGSENGCRLAGKRAACFAVEEIKRRAKSMEARQVAANVLQVFSLAMAFHKVRGALGSSMLGARAVQQRDAWLEGNGVPATMRLRAVRRKRGGGAGRRELQQMHAECARVGAAQSAGRAGEAEEAEAAAAGGGSRTRQTLAQRKTSRAPLSWVGVGVGVGVEVGAGVCGWGVE